MSTTFVYGQEVVINSLDSRLLGIIEKSNVVMGALMLVFILTLVLSSKQKEIRVSCWVPVTSNLLISIVSIWFSYVPVRLYTFSPIFEQAVRETVNIYLTITGCMFFLTLASAVRLSRLWYSKKNDRDSTQNIPSRLDNRT